MIFDAILKGLSLYNRLQSMVFFKWFPNVLKYIISLKTKYEIESYLLTIKSLNTLLYEYAVFLNMMNCEYDNFTPRKAYDNIRKFSITYQDSELIKEDGSSIKYISNITCMLYSSDRMHITIKCTYNFANNKDDKPSILGCYVYCKDGDENVEYSINSFGLNQFYNQLFDYIETNIVHDSMLMFMTYILNKKA